MIDNSYQVLGHQVELYSDNVERWAWWHRELADQDIDVPLSHRPNWIRDVSTDDHVFVEVRDGETETLTAGFPVEVTYPRSLPGHLRLRATRFGYALEPRGLRAALRALRLVVEQESRVLGLNIELFAPNSTLRTELEEWIQEETYERVEAQRRYQYSLRLDLSREEDEMLMSFSRSTRQSIREPEKKGFLVQPVEDERWTERMDDLWQETFARTGATPPSRNWMKQVSFARRHPDQYLIVGTFTPEYPEENSLVGFTCAKNNGDHAVYGDGASTRDIQSSVSLAYAPLWEAIKWSKSQGCGWFDMGGIPQDSYDEDPREGISRFKQRFTEDLVEVGTEWQYEPTTVRTTLSDKLSASASVIRRMLGRAG